MIKIVCWKWDNGVHPKKKLKFAPQHVNVLRNMVKRNLRIPHEFICITDNPEGIDPEIRTIPLWNDHRNLGGCYVRLKAFSKVMTEVIGERFCWIDLDTVIVNDITPLVDRDEDFMMYGDTNPSTPYNGSMCLMQAGQRSQVWELFNPRTSIADARKKGYVGTDQAWIGACLGTKEKIWTRPDGAYSFRVDLKGEQNPKTIVPLPHNARIVFFHGAADPSQFEIQQKYRWVKEHWQ